VGAIKAVIFDLDDTLYDCTGSLLNAARRRAACAMVEAGLPCSEREAFDLQVRLTRRYGPRCNVFDRIAEMYGLGADLVSRALEAYNSDEVGDISPFPDTVPTLRTLRAQGYRLFLVTSGITRRQQRKIERLGIAEFFDEIIIQDKELGIVREECLLDLMRRHALTPAEIVSVGDRIHSEIRVANHLKMTTVQMVHGRFKSLLPKNDLEEPDYRIRRLSEILGVLAAAREPSRRGEPRVVALGGGTGLPLLLEGLKRRTPHLTAIVTVMDSGRSSGVLRRDLGVLPPGDARNCLVALSRSEASERLLKDLFQYRFGEGGLKGMSMGNLLLAALEKMTGSFEGALREASRVLDVQGKVIPPTLNRAHLCARLADGRIVREEVNVRAAGKPRIERVFLDPPDVEVSAEAIQEIQEADLVVLGPGSLYTSVLPNLLVPGIVSALRRSDAPLVYVCNIATQPGQTDGYDAADHVRAVQAHLGGASLDMVLVNTGTPPPEILRRYAAEGAALVAPSDDLRRMPLQVVARDLVEQLSPDASPRLLWEKKDLIRHHPDKLAEALMDLL